MSPRPPRVVASVPRITLDIGEACAALGVSRDFFDGHIAGELRMIRRGRRKLIPVAELEAWAMREAKRTLPDDYG